MVNREVTRADPLSVPALGSSRARVLTALQNAQSPLPIAEVAEPKLPFSEAQPEDELPPEKRPLP